MNYRLNVDNEKGRYLVIPEMEKDVFHFFGTREFSIDTGDIKDKLLTVKQVHGDNILVIDHEIKNLPAFIKEISNKGYDAIITNQTDIILGIYTADCLPILIADPKNGIIASVHAGWRSAISGITIKCIEIFLYFFKSSPYNISAGLGPCIGQCCFEVGEVVVRQLKDKYPYWKDLTIDKGNRRWMVDLAELSERQLSGCGIQEENIHRIDLCTMCNPSLFFSYRRERKKRGRMLSGIML
ncbi:MAG: peptidoglycan editing factor PgeF [Nitrospirota bacterium]